MVGTSNLGSWRSPIDFGTLNNQRPVSKTVTVMDLAPPHPHPLIGSRLAAPDPINISYIMLYIYIYHEIYPMNVDKL